MVCWSNSEVEFQSYKLAVVSSILTFSTILFPHTHQGNQLEKNMEKIKLEQTIENLLKNRLAIEPYLQTQGFGSWCKTIANFLCFCSDDMIRSLLYIVLSNKDFDCLYHTKTTYNTSEHNGQEAQPNGDDDEQDDVNGKYLCIEPHIGINWIDHGAFVYIMPSCVHLVHCVHTNSGLIDSKSELYQHSEVKSKLQEILCFSKQE